VHVWFYYLGKERDVEKHEACGLMFAGKTWRRTNSLGGVTRKEISENCTLQTRPLGRSARTTPQVRKEKQSKRGTFGKEHRTKNSNRGKRESKTLGSTAQSNKSRIRAKHIFIPMAHPFDFFRLPPELRDLIYTQVILAATTLPSLAEAQSLRFNRANTSSDAKRTGEYGCAYQAALPPSTCANFLCCNRQVHAEMGNVLARLDGKNGPGLSVNMDCLTVDETMHYFSWVGIPRVRTEYHGDVLMGTWGRWQRWIEKWWLWAATCAGLRDATAALICATTRICRLCIRVRLVGTRMGKQIWLSDPQDGSQTSWAVCAALTRLLTCGPHLSAMPTKMASVGPPTTRLLVDTLVLDVVADSPAYPDLPAPSDAQTVQPKRVADDLLDIWAKVWGREGERRACKAVLEGIGRVVVCVDGVGVGTREVRNELERGRRALRGPW
jgi:hypothetical protein